MGRREKLKIFAHNTRQETTATKDGREGSIKYVNTESE